MSDAYKQAGVDIDAGTRAVEMMKTAVRSTYTPNVLADLGSFGGLFALTQLPVQPVLVASTDGVGTKVKLAAELGRWRGIGRGIGHDIVNHCVNDIWCRMCARSSFWIMSPPANLCQRRWPRS